MKTLKLFIVGSIILAAATFAAAQDTAKPTNPNFDAKLAAKLGADKRGMKNYVLAILKRGPSYDRIKGQKRKDLLSGHFANIMRLAKEGSLVVAGPFDDPEGDWAGLFVFNVDNVEAAKKLTDTDPTIQSGIFVGEFHKWYGSAAMMEVNRIHNTITP
jgi:uncharacterized protein YciI